MLSWLHVGVATLPRSFDSPIRLLLRLSFTFCHHSLPWAMVSQCHFTVFPSAVVTSRKACARPLPIFFYDVYGSQLHRVPWFFLSCHVQDFVVNIRLFAEGERFELPKRFAACLVSEALSSTQPTFHFSTYSPEPTGFRKFNLR